ncbi:MAG: hypothetical protein LBI79_09125 [Nitrososphaerota archaeon]|jgi:hypothetical protein|nr:hypothetical protein [Nitrososphaerota archaeon]
MSVAVHYRFSQHFAVSANDAYLWCTDFNPHDPVLMGEPNTKRQITQLTENLLILKETCPTEHGTVAKEKIIHLYPDRLMWVSMHLSGPNKYSQFIYEISAEKGGSTLAFTAHHIEHQKLTKKETDQLAEELCKYDSGVWLLLAKAMKKELNP